MEQSECLFCIGDVFTVVLDAGSPLPAGCYQVQDVIDGADGVRYRVRALDGGPPVEVEQHDLREFNRVLR